MGTAVGGSGRSVGAAEVGSGGLAKTGTGSAKVMAIAVHPYISGVPHRIKYFESVLRRLAKRKDVLIWNGAQILDWYLKSRKR